MLPDLKYVIKSLLGWKLLNDVEQLSKTDNDKVELHFLSHYMCSSIYAMYKKKQNPVPEKAESGSRKSRIRIKKKQNPDQEKAGSGSRKSRIRIKKKQDPDHRNLIKIQGPYKS